MKTVTVKSKDEIITLLTRQGYECDPEGGMECYRKLRWHQNMFRYCETLILVFPLSDEVSDIGDCQDGNGYAWMNDWFKPKGE